MPEKWKIKNVDRLLVVVAILALAVVGPIFALGDLHITTIYYSTEQQAKTFCGSDTVVWLNLRTNVFHLKESRWYGKTKRGAFMCQKDAEALGATPAWDGVNQ